MCLLLMFQGVLHSNINPAPPALEDYCVLLCIWFVLFENSQNFSGVDFEKQECVILNGAPLVWSGSSPIYISERLTL